MRLETKTAYCHNILCRHTGQILGNQFDDYHAECPECGFKTYKAQLPDYILNKIFVDVRKNLESYNHLLTKQR